MAETEQEFQARRERALRYFAETDEKRQRAVWLDGGRRCAVRQSENIDGWWVGESPRNGEGAVVEGPWEDWVTMARNILAYDEKIQRGEATAGIPPVPSDGEGEQ